MSSGGEPSSPAAMSTCPGSAGSGSSDEGHDDVGGVAVEVLASAVVERGGAGVGVAGGELHVTQRHAGIERGHDQRSPEHVWMDMSETGPLADRFDPSMRRPAIETLTIVAQQDRALAPFADCEVHGARRAWHERDDGRLASLAEDPQRAVPAIEAEIADVGVACLAHPQPVQPEQDRERGALVSEVFGGEQDRPSSVRSIPCPWLGCTFGCRTYWAGFDAIRPSMCANRYSPHTVARRRSIVDAASPRCSM